MSSKANMAARASSAVKISQASSLALHTLALLAGRGGQRASTGRIARTLGVSQAHLAKVLARLRRVGLVRAIRGPGGGFVLARPARRIALLAVYEAIEGPLGENACLLGRKRCPRRRCIFGTVVAAVNARIRRYLARTNLSQLADTHRKV